MAETFKGKAVIWGANLSSTLSTATGGVYQFGTGAIVASYDWAVDSNNKEILNSIGDCAALVFTNVKRSLTIEVIPAGSSTTVARANNTLPNPGDTVRIVDPDSSDVDGTFSADYIFISGTKRASQDSELRMTFNLVQYTANNLANTVT